jgi:hypothetical protein
MTGERFLDAALLPAFLGVVRPFPEANLREYAMGADWEWEREIAVIRLLTPGLMTRVANGTLGGSEEERTRSARPGFIGIAMAALRCGGDMALS